MITNIFNYYSVTSRKEISAQAVYFEDGAYAFKSNIETECHEQCYPPITHINLIEKNGEKTDCYDYEKYYEFLKLHNVKRLVANICLFRAKNDLKSDSICKVFNLIDNSSIKEKSSVYYNRLQKISSSLKYDDVSNYNVREMCKLSEAFYLLQKELKERKEDRSEKMITSNSHGIINISKTVHMPSMNKEITL
jgi:hypothetical protein